MKITKEELKSIVREVIKEKYSSLNEESDKFIAKFNGKTIEVHGKDLWDAKKKAIVALRVPKSKVGLLSVNHENYYKNQDFRFESDEDCGCNSVNEVSQGDKVKIQIGSTVKPRWKNGTVSMVYGTRFTVDVNGKLYSVDKTDINNTDRVKFESINEESEYATFFRKALEKAGKDIKTMSDEEKRSFFDKVDVAWKGKGEKPEVNEMNPAMTAMIARQTIMNPQTKKKIKASSAASDPDNPLYDKAKALIKKVKDRFSKKESVNEKFNKAQLDLLKTGYANIDKINPSSEPYKKLIALLDRLDKSDLEQLATADIKFVSMLAKNRLVKK